MEVLVFGLHRWEYHLRDGMVCDVVYGVDLHYNRFTALAVGLLLDEMDTGGYAMSQHTHTKKEKFYWIAHS